MQITIIGAGVIGLTTALVLEERGHDVRMVAVASDQATTSAIAGAVWFPYRCGPPAQVARWAATTRAWLEELAADHATGVDLLTGYEITRERGLELPRPWWATHVEVARAPAPVVGAPLAWQFMAPRVQPSTFVPWIRGRLRAPLEVRAVHELASEPGDVVINCSGLAAGELAADPLISPLLGQIVITDPGTVDLRVTITDDRDPDAPFYVIPRRDELVVGGCATPWPRGDEPRIDPAVTTRILDHARRLGVALGPVRAVRVGLRPYRPEVRLERAGRIIHNYGHGGAGFTLCRGCAEDVAALVDDPARGALTT